MTDSPNILHGNELRGLRQTAKAAAIVAGEVLISWRGRFSVREKNRHDLVTDADVDAQRAVAQTIALRYPDHALLGEESDHHLRPGENEYCWIVDPLDGTTNYVHGFPAWCVSVAVCLGNTLLAAAIFDPVKNELFTAAIGQGADLDGQPLRVSDCESVANALVASSLPATVRHDSPDLRSLVALATTCRGVRRTGSAALNLAYVASGRLDAFTAAQIFPWDVAAGVLLVSEAGGVVTGVRGEPFELYNPHFRAASTPSLHAELGELLIDALR